MKKFIAALMIFACANLFAAPMKLTTDQQKKLNVFFSNFSESYVPSFTEATDEIMTNFALSHNYINKFKSLKTTKDGLSVTVTPDQLDTTAKKYFGKPIIKHREKIYTMPLADGEAFTFSQLDSLEDLGDKLFKAEGTIYMTSSGGTPDVHANPEAWKKADEEVEAISKFSAKIKSEGDRYILVEYTVTDTRIVEETVEGTSEDIADEPEGIGFEPEEIFDDNQTEDSNQE